MTSGIGHLPLPSVLISQKEEVLGASATINQWLSSTLPITGSQLHEVLPAQTYHTIQEWLRQAISSGHGNILLSPAEDGQSSFQLMLSPWSDQEYPNAYLLSAIAQKAFTGSTSTDHHLVTVFNLIKEGIGIYDKDYRLVSWNQVYQEMDVIPRHMIRKGVSLYEIYAELGKTGIFGTKDNAEIAQGHIDTLRNKNIKETEIVFPASGKVIQIHRYYLPDGGICAIFLDITEQHNYEKKLTHFANIDTLTDLPNRHCFLEKITEYINQNTEQSPFSLFFVDLDNFKLVNDSYGHPVGDDLLRQTAKRLQVILNASDPLNIIARTGGDEFVVLVRSAQTREQAQELSEIMCACLAEPFIINNNHIFTNASIGVSMYPEHAIEASSLITKADSALCKAKLSGNCAAFFNSLIGDELSKRLRIANTFRKELLDSDDRLRLVVQPIVNLATHEIIGGEALLRWDGLQENAINVGEFIEILEQHGMILEVGNRVIDLAMCYLSRVSKIKPDFYLSFNASPLQIAQSNIAERVIRGVMEYNLKPECICVEITESTLMLDSTNITENLKKIRNFGVNLAIDDFGTGFSSLSYIKNYPFTHLKVDQSFVNEIPRNTEHCHLINAIMDISQAFGVKVIAEGIETVEQADYLLKQHCSIGQGYYFSRPIQLEEIEEKVRHQELQKHMAIPLVSNL